jgi:transposase
LDFLPKGLLGNAIGYTLSRWDQLTLYVDYGFVSPDNNLAENAIRPFVVGRKNWLFCDTPAGAEAMAGLYNLIETARANGLNPFEYLKELFEKLPAADTDDHLRLLLPQYHDATAAG